MSLDLQAFTALYDQLDHPVLLFDADTLHYQNQASLTQLPGLTHERAMEISSGVYRYGANCFTAQVQTIGAQTLVTLLPCEDPQILSPETLEVISQTLRGSLSTAMSVSQLLFPRLEQLDDARIQLEAATLSKSLYQLMRLSSNLSDTALLFQSECILNRREIDLATWLRELTDSLQSYCQLCSVTLRDEIPALPCWAFIDTASLRRAVLNLVSNALKYTQPGGTISISLEAGKKHYRLKVSDDGEGIPPEEIDRVCDRSQPRPLLGDPRWGVGLGLQLVRQIVQLHGGTMMVESQSRGGFSVILSLDRLSGPETSSEMHNATSAYDYASGFDPFLMELSDALPASSFRTQHAE